MPDYEVLQDVGNGALTRAIKLPILEEEFGDGFEASATIGDTAGVLLWTLQWKSAHRDSGPLIQAKTYLNSNIGSPVSRYNYLMQFLMRRVTSNRYFWIYDPDRPTSRPAYLCRVVKLAEAIKAQQNQRDPLFYQFSFQIQQVRGAPAQT